MEIINKNIDGGKSFDWGRTSDDYAKFRDIYPQEFYERIVKRGLCIKGQNVLDIGTGTGVIPRNMACYGANWTGTDISENQIKQAKLLSEDMNIDYHVIPAEKINFPDSSFDVITACQCFWYFDHFEDKIANASEKLVLKYNPEWSGGRETMHPIFIPECYSENFELVFHEEYQLNVHFTRESWNGRMKACRGVGASLSEQDIASWEKEHMNLLSEIASDEFDILHYAATAELKRKF